MLRRVATLTALLTAARTAGTIAARSAEPAKLSFSEPSFSADGSEIVFASGGDIWSVSRMGGEARLLVSHPATESRPLMSPDGTRLAFISTRTGNGDVYVLTLANGELTRITYDDANDQLDAWSRDGRWLYFSSSSHDISGMNDVFRVSAGGGTPMPVAADRYVSEYWGAPSPDGSTLAITARGTTSTQWWRHGHSHLDESEIWLVTMGARPGYRRLTTDSGGAKELWPMWSADGRDVFYVSDRGGAENIWKRPTAGGAAMPLTDFRSGRVLWPQMSFDGTAITFERGFGIWTLSVASGEAREVPITLKGTAAGPAREHLTLTGGATDLAVSADGKKIAFTMHGDVFAAAAAQGGDAVHVTNTTAAEGQPAWAPDSRRLAYTSDRDGASHIYVYDFVTAHETRLTNTAKNDNGPMWSPDGRSILFTRDGTELRLLDVASIADRAIASGQFDRPPALSEQPYAYSPDGQWIAYLSSGERGFANAFVVAASGGAGHQVSFSSGTSAGWVRWSADGTYLLHRSGQRTEGARVMRVDIAPRTSRFREDQFRHLFPGDTTPSGIPRTQLVFDGIRQRATALPLNLDVVSARVSPDGKTLLAVASAAGQQQLWTWPLDDDAPTTPAARQITSSAGVKTSAQFSPDGREVWFLEDGHINVVNVESRASRTVTVSAEMDVDFALEKMEAFHQAWSLLRDNFFDNRMNGSDWTALGDQYRARVAGARTPDDTRRILNLMIGELNASHSGVSGPPATPPYSGRIGANFDRTEYEQNGRLRITEIIPFSPIALAEGARVGDCVLSVNGMPTGATVNLDELLAHTIGRRVTLSVAALPNGMRREVVVRPVSTAAEKTLLYRAWVEERRAYVSKASNGRLGYVHMFDMSAESLTQLYVDLDADNQARDGVVIDLRNNNGGFVNAYALDVFTRRGYLTMQSRGRPATPARTQSGQRALEKPTILVVNQHTLSDAEDFTEGYRALKLGRIVGEPTAGWIIYTSTVRLIDGTTLRLPATRIRGADGKDLEMSARGVDALVVRPVGESYSERDSQLDAAVTLLLAQLAK